MKRNIKKLVIMLFAAAFILSFTQSFSVAAASKAVKVKSFKKGTTFVYNGLKYKITKASAKNPEAAVIGVKKIKKKLVIPDTVQITYSSKGKAVSKKLKITTVGANAFSSQSIMTTVTLGKNVTVIKKFAFSYCYALKKVIIKKNSKLKKIEDQAFFYDYTLSLFDFSKLKNLESISDNAFLYCYNVNALVPRDKMVSVIKLKKAAKKYSYVVEPLVAPINNYFYVRTSNKNMQNIRFVDKSTEKKKNEGGNILSLVSKQFLDVKYENKTKGRVKGGYIYSRDGGTNSFDGGELTLQVYSIDYGWIDTDIKVDSADVVDVATYVYDKYTSSSASFDKNMNAVTKAMSDAFVGYVTIYDTSAYNDNKIKYPYISNSGYDYYNTSSIYKSMYGSLLAYECYPFKYYNMSDILEGVIKRLDPKAKTSFGYYSTVTVERNGTSKIYSVEAYNYNTEPIYKKYVEPGYTFDDSDRDYAGNYSLTFVKERLRGYIDKSKLEEDKLKKKITDTYSYSKLGHCSWIKTYGNNYTYVTQGIWYLNGNYGYLDYNDAWVDGRYINGDGVYKKGARFEDHPTAKIVKRNMTYTNCVGEKKTGDVVFEYDSTTGTWKSYAFEYVSYSVYYGILNTLQEGEEYPKDHILTKADVAKMNVDKNTDQPPTNYVIFDGTVPPGTRVKSN